jgi:superfamily II RNA helicase
MTTEILMNKLFLIETPLTAGTGTTSPSAQSLTFDIDLENDLGAVVFDEVHMINSPDRGHVWEETLILAAKNLTTPLQLVLLSATLPSASSLAGWLAELHQRRTWLLSTTYRIVPLVHGVLEPTAAGWKVTTSELGFKAKNFTELGADQMKEVAEFLQAIDDNDDVHRVYAAVK